MTGRPIVTEADGTEYTRSADPRELVGRRVRVLDDELNPAGNLGAWFVTGLDHRNTAHVIVAKVDDARVECWSIHNGQLRIRP